MLLISEEHVLLVSIIKWDGISRLCLVWYNTWRNFLEAYSATRISEVLWITLLIVLTYTPLNSIMIYYDNSQPITNMYNCVWDIIRYTNVPNICYLFTNNYTTPKLTFLNYYYRPSLFPINTANISICTLLIHHYGLN